MPRCVPTYRLASTHLLTVLPTRLPTYLLTYLPTDRLTNSSSVYLAKDDGFGHLVLVAADPLHRK